MDEQGHWEVGEHGVSGGIEHSRKQIPRQSRSSTWMLDHGRLIDGCLGYRTMHEIWLVKGDEPTLVYYSSHF
jgi:hypothetical protein